MSSWIPSLFNPFADGDNPDPPEPSSPSKTTPRSPTSGAKDDISAVFRGVASFLGSPRKAVPSSSSETIAGIKNDLAEIEDPFRSGLSLISSKLTSNLMQFQDQFNKGNEYDEVEEEEGVGVSEEVLDFVLKISRRPELWTDFPLSLTDDFDLSECQREHAASIDHLVPDFETLRKKICSQMSEVAEARVTLLKKVQSKTDEDHRTSENPKSSDTKQTEIVNESSEDENATKQAEIVNKTESGHHQSEKVDTRPSNDAPKQPGNEEDVSFSDLEDDDNDVADKPSAPKVITSNKAWFQVDEHSGSEGAKQKADERALKDKETGSEDSNDWLTVDDTDFDNLGAI